MSFDKILHDSNIKEIKENLKSDKKNIAILLKLNFNQLNNIGIKIIKYHQLGFKFFILDFNSIKTPYSVVIVKLNEIILRLLSKFDIIIFIKSLPKCIFQKNILKPEISFEFEDKLLYYNNFEDKNSNKYVKISNICNNCRYNKDCIGINVTYKNNFGMSEFETVKTNNYFINKYKDYSENNFKNKLIKEKINLILDNLKNSNIHYKKRFYFVDSFPDNLKESSKERIVYFIYNNKRNFEKDFNLFLNILNTKNEKNYLLSLKNYFKKTNEFVISCSLMGDNKIRNTIYLSVNYFSKEELIYLLEKKLNLTNINYNNIWGVGIDFRDNKITSKLYYRFKRINKLKLINFVLDINDVNKQKYLYFLDKININIFNNILYDLKYKNGILFAKKIEFSFQTENLDLDLISNILNINKDILKKRVLFTIAFELYSNDNNKEKINLYWSIK